MVYHQNIRSVKPKKDELSIFLLEECNSPDIVCISEHHMHEIELLNFSILGYKLATGFSWKLYKNGGVCILVKDNISYQTVDVQDMCIEKTFEACAIKIQIDTIRICILCLYRAPTGNINNSVVQLETTLKYQERTNSEFIIIGDTNTNFLIDNYKKEQLQRMLNTYKLTQVIDFPTRIGPTTASLIDNLFLDRHRKGKFQLYSVLNGLSDHDGQILKLENLQVSTK
jgi:exonuclease III